MDLFTRLFKRHVIPTADNQILSYVPIKELDLDTNKGIKKFVMYDHVFFHTPRFLLGIVMKLLSLLPMYDSNIRKNYTYLIDKFKTDYKQVLRHLDVLKNQNSFDALSELNHEPGSDTNLQLLLKQGPASMLIMQIDDGLYKVDLSEMSSYEVRPGFIPYGGCVYFNSNFDLISIKYMDNVYTPDSTYWPQIKYIFRSSLMTYNTIKYHAGYFHLLYGSHLPFALNVLPQDHYLKKLMLPFTYKNSQASELARIVLYGNRRYFHRMFAFTDKGLDDFNKYIFDNLNMFNIVEQQLILDLDIIKNSPYFEDGDNLWTVIESFIDKYLNDHYVKDDKHIDTMVNTLMENSKGKFDIKNDIESISIFLTQYIFISSCVHEIIGNHMMKYAYDPRFMSAKLRWSNDVEDMYPDEQTYNQTMLLTVGTSLMKMPGLSDDFSHIFDNEADKILAVDFNNALKELSETINERNKTREYPFYGSHPNFLEISMSV